MVEKKQKGFTLIELLIVIAIIIILAAIVFVALNPLQRFQQARNAQRWADITAMLNAIKIDQVDNQGTYLAVVEGLVDGTTYEIGTCAAGDATCSGSGAVDCVNLDPLPSGDQNGLVDEGYLGSIPVDPSSGTAANAGYSLVKDATGIIKITACNPEAGETISASR